MSNAPYILVLDCDMYCNDPLSAKQAMCFHLDPSISNSLSYVQFPQIFYNVSKNDIYDGQARSAYKVSKFFSINISIYFVFKKIKNILQLFLELQVRKIEK